MADKIYEIFDSLREEKGVTVYAISKATGIKTTTFTNWKKGKYTPKQEKLQKIADYFGVSVDYLINGEEQKQNEYSTEAAKLVRKIRKDKELSEALLKYFELPEEKKKHIINTINMM